MSLDGYIADKEHGVEWIVGNGSNPDASLADFSFNDFLEKINTIVMGRKFWEVTFRFDSIENPFPNKKIIVMSSNKNLETEQNIKISKQPIKEIIAKSHGDVWVFGGSSLIK